MRALVLDSHLHLKKDISQPDIPSGEALIRVLQAGICSTDLELVLGYMGFTGIPGHEFVGIVEQAPDRAELTGCRVVGEINAACRKCETCAAGRVTHCPHRTTLGINGRNGAFAEYLCLPYENLHVIPEELSNDQAVFTEPLAAACEITQQVHIQPSHRILVIGDGKLGLLCSQVLGLTGCSLTVLGHHIQERAWLQERGIRIATSPKDINTGLDLVVEATGSPEGLLTAIELVRPRGTIILKSTYHGDLTFNMSKLVIDEVSLIGSRCGPFSPAIRLLDQGLINVTPLIQSRYSIEDGLSAFEYASQKGILKVILQME